LRGRRSGRGRPSKLRKWVCRYPLRKILGRKKRKCWFRELRKSLKALSSWLRQRVGSISFTVITLSMTLSGRSRAQYKLLKR
jgi:hypothetical protein